MSVQVAVPYFSEYLQILFPYEVDCDLGKMADPHPAGLEYLVEVAPGELALFAKPFGYLSIWRYPHLSRDEKPARVRGHFEGMAIRTEGWIYAAGIVDFHFHSFPKSVWARTFYRHRLI